MSDDDADDGAGPGAGSGSTATGTAAKPFDHEYDPDGLAAAAVTVVRAADLIRMRSGRGAPDLGDKEWAARRSHLPPAFRAVLDGELMLLRAQLYSSGLFREIVTEVLQAAAAHTDYEYDPDGLVSAAVTLRRIADLIGMRSGRGDPRFGDKDWAARRSDLSPSFRAAMDGELMLARAQLFSTGVFREIVNVDLGGGGRSAARVVGPGTSPGGTATSSPPPSPPPMRCWNACRRGAARRATWTISTS